MKKGHNESVGHHVASATKTIEFLHGEIKQMEFEAMELAQQNAALKCQMSSRDARWKMEKQAMQDQIDSAKQGQAFDSGRAMQTELEDELKELKLVLKDKEKHIYKLSSRPRNNQFEIERVKRELSDKCNQVKAMKHIISEKDAVIANVTNVKVAIGHQNLELMLKLRRIQREVHPIQNEWKIKANALEDSLKAEQAEKKACYEKIKKLENLLKDREDSFNKKRELRSVQTEIPQRVKFEQGEKEACKAPPASTAPQAKKRPRSPSPGTSSKKFRPEEKQAQELKPTCPKNSTTGVLPTKRIVSLVSRPGFSAPTARQGTNRPRSPSAEPSSKTFTPEEKGVKVRKRIAFT